MSPTMLGAYGPWAALLVDRPASLSFRREEWTDAQAWRPIARQRLLARLAPPSAGATPEVTVHHRSVYDGLHAEHLSWQLPYGPPTEAILLKPAGVTGRLPGILALHDHAGDKYFGKRKIARTAGDWHPLMLAHQAEYYGGVPRANEIAKRGYAVLVPDAFSFASRRVRVEDVPEVIRAGCTDPISEIGTEIDAYNQWAAGHESIMAKSLFCAGTTWPGVLLAEDQRALDVLCAREDVDADCGGLSGGGLRTVYLGGIDPRVRCAVCGGMMTTWRDFLLSKCHTHTWMIYIPLLPTELDYPEILGLRVPLPTMVLNNLGDPLFTLQEMERANEIMQEVYTKAGAGDRYQGHFFPGPHKFDLEMQAVAFDWFDRWLRNQMSSSLSPGFYPFWFWNDALTADEICWQVQQMAAQGVKGFFIHPRQGLWQPYLSASFFEMADCAISAAREHGLVVHLYDECPYPSGIAGGEVVLGSPQYNATDLLHESHIVEGGRVRLALPRGNVLSCVAYPLENGETDWERGMDLAGHVGMVLTVDSYLETGLTAYNQKRYFASEPDLVAQFAKTYPQAKLARSVEEILEDETIHVIASAAIPCERAPLGIAVMQHGKDFMSDKPGFTTLAQLAESRQVQAQTGRIYSIYFSERLGNRATVKAGELVKAGAVGQVVQTVGLGPHRIGLYDRPDWFFRREQYGGTLTDIASHQVDQFLFFTGSTHAEVVAAQVANYKYPHHPELEDFGDMVLQGDRGTGYIRVDWYTPDGLPTWGDGRLVVLGTEGYIELRKYCDIAGRSGGDHLFLVDKKGMHYIDCSDVDMPYGRQLMDDVLNRTETAMPQDHCFLASELALKAQARAQRLGNLT